MPIKVKAFGNIANVTVSLADGVDAIVEQTGGSSGPQATVMLQCDWLDRFTVYKALLGATQLVGNKIVRLPPATYPTSPNLFCTSISNVKGTKPKTDVDGSVTGVEGWLYYEKAIITAIFSNPLWEADQGESQPPQDASAMFWTTTRVKTNAEVFNPPFGSYTYSTGKHAGETVRDSSVGFIRSHAEVTFTRHFMPEIPLWAGVVNQGCVNDKPIQVADYLFPRGCMLFAGISAEPKPDPATGETTYDVDHTFLCNEGIEWNELMDPDGEYELVIDQDGNHPFEYVNFDGIFSDEPFFEPE